MPFTLISGGLGVAGNLIGGFLGRSAANKAAAIQKEAADKAAAHVEGVTAATNPQIGEAAKLAGTHVTEAAGTADTRLKETADTAATNVNTATGQSNALLDPYSDAGKAAAEQLRLGIAPGGQFNAQPTMKDIQIDPGYAWRLQQGLLAQNNSAAARGGALSGAAVKDALNYGQGLGSQEYQNAFTRYQQNRQNNFSNVLGVSNQGQAAGIEEGRNLTAAARYGGDLTADAAKTGGVWNIGAQQYAGTAGMNAADLMTANTINAAKTGADYQTGGAAAQAGGIVGGTNALTQGITGATNAVGGAISLQQLLKNPALSNPNPNFAVGTRPFGYGSQPVPTNNGLPLPLSSDVLTRLKSLGIG